VSDNEKKLALLPLAFLEMSLKLLAEREHKKQGEKNENTIRRDNRQANQFMAKRIAVRFSGRSDRNGSIP
jgi:hypothetical protein